MMFLKNISFHQKCSALNVLVQRPFCLRSGCSNIELPRQKTCVFRFWLLVAVHAPASNAGKHLFPCNLPCTCCPSYILSSTLLMIHHELAGPPPGVSILSSVYRQTFKIFWEVPIHIFYTFFLFHFQLKGPFVLLRWAPCQVCWL